MTRLNQTQIDHEVLDWVAAEGIGLPLPTTSVLGNDIDKELQRRYDFADQCAHHLEIRAWAYQESARNFWFWRNNFGWVFDDIKLGCPIPAIRWEFHGDIQASYLGLEGWRNTLDELQFAAWKKSRRLGFTVAICLAAAWGFAVSSEHSGSQIMVSLQRDRVDDNTCNWSASTFSKIRNILDWMPEWMQPLSWRRKRRFADRHLTLSCEERASYIKGLGANVESLRSMRGWRLFFDEANSIPHIESALSAGKKVGPIICGSSVTTRATGFWKLCSGKISKVVEKGESGLVVRTAHYSQHPEYDPTTEHGRKRIEAEKAEMSTEAWNEEMEVNPSTVGHGLIWAGYYRQDLHEVTAANLRQHMEIALGGLLIEGWDFGDSPSLTSVVWARYVIEIDTLYIMDYRSWEHGEAVKVAQDISALGYHTGLKPGLMPDVRIGDIADRRSMAKAAGGRRQAPIRGWKKNLRAEGIEILSQQLEVEQAIKLIRDKLIGRRILVMPAACRRHDSKFPSVSECFVEYKWYLPKGIKAEDYSGDRKPSKNNLYSHTSDVVQHLGVAAWGYP